MAHVLLSALSARRGGGLTYLRHIVPRFPADEGHRLSIVSSVKLPDFAGIDGVECIRVPSLMSNPIARATVGRIYFRFFWKRRKDFDAVYYPGGSFDVPLPRGPARIVAFRNMAPFDPEARLRYALLSWERLRTWLLRRVQARAFSTADLVIFISAYAKSVIDRLLPKRAGISVVVPHGVETTTGTLSREIAAALPTEFVLYLSILDVYKAHVELVESWALLKHRWGGAIQPKLVLAGPEYAPYGRKVRATIERLGLQRDVILIGAVPHDEISALTERATLNVFLSACENCPNILLELMSAGRPVISSNREPMPEFGGDALDYVDPYDVIAVADIIDRYLKDPSLGEAHAAAAQVRSTAFDWNVTARRTWQAILATAARSLQSKK